MKKTIYMMLLLLALPMAAMAQDVTFTATSASIEGFQGQTYQKAFDSDINTKWCGNAQNTNGEVRVNFEASSLTAVNGYYFITGDDVTYSGLNRNPKAWTLYAKVNLADDWTKIGEELSATLTTSSKTPTSVFEVTDKTTKYQYFSLEIHGIVDGNVFELSEICLDLDNDDSSPLNYVFDTQHGTAMVGNNQGITGDVVIPETVTKDGVIYRVAGIEAEAFMRSKNLTNIVIPNSLTSIGEKAFYGCSSLLSVNIPNAVTTISTGVFHNCDKLTSVSIPNSVTTIQEEAFHNCRSLTSIDIPNSVTVIGSHAFSDCGLASITIPNSVTSIGELAFFCFNLKSIYCYAENPPSINNIVEEDFLETIMLHVPDASIQAYKNHANWGLFKNIVGIDFAQKYQTELMDFFTLLTAGETISSNMQSKLEECMAMLDQCSTEAKATQLLNETCKPALISAYISEKKSLLTAAMKGESNDYLNEVHDECMAEIEAADAAHDAGAAKRAINVGIAAVTSARIMYKQLESGITPDTPQGAGMRMKVTTKSGKVYEFKTSDVESVDYYRVNE